MVGFDDLPLAASLDPPLTTVRQERNELGRCAYVVLNSLVHHIPFCRTQIRAKLIERESTARYQAPAETHASSRTQEQQQDPPATSALPHTPADSPTPEAQ